MHLAPLRKVAGPAALLLLVLSGQVSVLAGAAATKSPHTRSR